MHKLVTQLSYRPRITFQDTNIVGNVYFLTFFRWQAECRDRWLSEGHPELWNSIRTGQSQVIITNWATTFSDPVGATVGDDIEVTIEFDESENQYSAVANIARVAENGAQSIGTGRMQFVTASQFSRSPGDLPSGPCYEYSDNCSRVSHLDALELVAWQGKCRELFLADHAPNTLRLVAQRHLALQTSSASLELHRLPTHLDEVRLEMRLEGIKCGQIDVRFDYFSVSNGSAIHFATGRQRMSSKRYVGVGIAPCALPTDMLQALSRFTRSDRLLDKIASIIDFAEHGRLV